MMNKRGILGLTLGITIRRVSALALLSASLMAAEAPAGKHLFILSGQSNMVKIDPAVSLAPTLEAKFGKENVIVVKYANSGKPIRLWVKNWQAPEGVKAKDYGIKNGELYDLLMKSVKEATAGQTIQTVTFMWMQGEADASEGLSACYKQSFLALMSQLQQDLGRDRIPFVIGRISDSYNPSKDKDWAAIRSIQVELAEESPLGEWVSTDDCNDGLNAKGQVIKNGLHYSITGYETLGRRFAEKGIQLLSQ